MLNLLLHLLLLPVQALSSRLEQLLPLGSLVFKDESGYRTFYSHLLKPHVHYLPFWDGPDNQPQDILEQLDWAQVRDQEGSSICNMIQTLRWPVVSCTYS